MQQKTFHNLEFWGFEEWFADIFKKAEIIVFRITAQIFSYH